MKYIFKIVLLLYVGIITLTLESCSSKSGSPQQIAPDFMLSDIEGNRFYLSDQKGKVVVLNFWSIYCSPCLVEMPKIQQLSDSLSKKEVSFVGICNDPGEGGYAESLLKKMGITYTNLIDDKKAVSEKYSVTALPTTFILDNKYRIRYRKVGYDESCIRKYREICETIIHEYETGK